MSVLTGALGSLAPKLLQLLHDEYKLQKGVRKQVQWLHSELESIHAFLREVGNVPCDRLNEQVKVWARQVREASYDMEDVLDRFFVHVDGGEPAEPGRLKRAMKKMGKVFSKAKARHGIAGAIKDIKKHLEEVAERRRKYKLDEIIMSKRITAAYTIDPRLSAMYREVTQLIGIDKSMDEVISMLNLCQPADDVPDNMITKKVSIVGIGGLGKTTLANVVYNKLKPQFDCVAFVSVGRDHDLAKVFKDILFDLDKKRYDKIHNTRRGVNFLIREVREFLENKRYFLVVDDVWEVQTWKTINLVLVESNFGSKVITTTRKFDVAEEAGEVYKLKPLSNNDSMKLFYKRIFGAEPNYLDNQPDDISNKILMKCGGIPLAIITMSSLLAGKQNNEWFEVYNSIGFGSKGNMEVEDTMRIISFSYYDMPPHLRTCLLYLSTYPEDYWIDMNSLIWKWIAEGFVHEKQGERLFDIGESYFNDLINRIMIQEADNRLEVRKGHIHDIVLDLLRRISFEENFIAILDGNAEAISPSSNVCRFAIHKRTAENVCSESKVHQMPKVRSYIAFACYINNNWVHFPSFGLLRVLDLIECTFKVGCHLEHLGHLVHLRYLGIECGGFIPKLSTQISNLKLLQTLVLDGYLPVNTILPTQLLSLCTVWKVPNGLGKLVSLEQLSILSDPKMLVKELSTLRELRALAIYNTACDMDKSMQRDFVVSLSNLQKIQKIEMYTVHSLNLDTDIWEEAGFVLPRSLRHLNFDACFCFSKIPSCINPSCLPNLSYLGLQVDTMDEKNMKNLARLPALSHLRLIIKSTITASVMDAGGNDGCLQKLRCFEINAMVQLQQHKKDFCISLHIWNREESLLFGSGKSNCSKNVPSAMMPNLEVLDFYVPLRALKDNNHDCGNIGLEYLPSLRQLTVHIDCEGVSAEEVDDALAALRQACKVHPNHPTLDTITFNRKKTVYTKEEVSTEEEDEEDDFDLGEDFWMVHTKVEVSTEEEDEEDEEEEDIDWDELPFRMV